MGRKGVGMLVGTLALVRKLVLEGMRVGIQVLVGMLVGIRV
jgi:hypothetical protein